MGVRGNGNGFLLGGPAPIGHGNPRTSEPACHQADSRNSREGAVSRPVRGLHREAVPAPRQRARRRPDLTRAPHRIARLPLASCARRLHPAPAAAGPPFHAHGQGHLLAGGQAQSRAPRRAALARAPRLAPAPDPANRRGETDARVSAGALASRPGISSGRPASPASTSSSASWRDSRRGRSGWPRSAGCRGSARWRASRRARAIRCRPRPAPGGSARSRARRGDHGELSGRPTSGTYSGPLAAMAKPSGTSPAALSHSSAIAPAARRGRSAPSRSCPWRGSARRCRAPTSPGPPAGCGGRLQGDAVEPKPAKPSSRASRSHTMAAPAARRDAPDEALAVVGHVEAASGPQAA